MPQPEQSSIPQVNSSHPKKEEHAMKIAKSLLSVLAVSLWLAFATEVCAADLLLGTWKLNVAKSKYSPGPAPKSVTVTYEAAGDGYKRTGESIAADGKKTSFEYTAKYDGKDYPVKGSENFDAISVKRIDDHNTEATLKNKSWRRQGLQ
jgi:hypothetical protein